jgi:hypothetical protein
MENQQEETLTQEQVDLKKDEMLQFYTESLSYLDAQLKYEETLMLIDEVRFKRAQFQLQYAMMMAPPEEDELTDQAAERMNPETPFKKTKKQ